MSLLRFSNASFTGRSLAGLLAAGVASLFLAACGGGGGDPGTPPFGGGGSPKATRLALALTDSAGAVASSLPNSGTTRITATVTALDANNTVVPNAAVTFAVTGGAELIAAGTTTDANGKLTATVGIGNDRSTRSVTVTATTSGSGGVSASSSFLINGAKLKANVTPVAAPNTPIVVTVDLQDASANPMVGEKVTLTANGVAAGDLTTTSQGKVSFNVTTPAENGGFSLVVTAAGETASSVVQVQSSSVPAAIGTITGVAVAANPSVVSANSATTDNSTTLRAQFRGAGNVPIQNVRVWFTLPDPNSVGGTLGDSTIVYSDSTGTATTTYKPGGISSPTDGVTVLACYSNVDFTVTAGSKVCPTTASDGSPVQSKVAALTVVDQALRIDIGTDELIGLGTGTYTKDYVVVVVDAAGRAKADVEITPKLDLTAFYKGYYDWNGEAWVRNAPVGVLQFPGCRNEDLDRNGFLSAGEDTNGNGNLDPGGVSITMLGAAKTDASGKATVRIEYPRDRATWIDFVITVTGRVGGSEGVAVYQGNLAGLGNLPAPGESFRLETVTPAFAVSRYGRSPGCDNTN